MTQADLPAPGGDLIGAIWLELRAAAGTMTLWGQVAAAEMPGGEVSRRILEASEQLVAVIEKLEEATGWSEANAPRPKVLAVPTEDPRPRDHECALALLFASEGDHPCRAVPAGELATLRQRLQEVLERPVRAVILPQSGRLVCGDLVLDVDGHTVDVAGKRVALPEWEYRALAVLMANAGRVVRPADLAQAAWKVSATPKQIGGVIHMLRKHLAPLGASVAVRTMKPLGYLVLPVPEVTTPPTGRARIPTWPEDQAGGPDLGGNRDCAFPLTRDETELDSAS